MRVVVTGAGGYSGHVIAAELSRKGYDVLGVDVRPPEQRVVPNRIIDVRDYGQVVDALRGADRVIHFADIPGSGSVAGSELYRINAGGTFHVLEAASALGVKQVIFASSIEVYGYCPRTRDFASFEYLPIDENHPALPVNIYAAAKQGAEMLCAAYSRMSDMSTVSLRLTKLMRHADYHLVPEWSRDMTRGKELIWSYVDVRDVATLCALIFERTELKGEIFHAGAADTICREDTRALAARAYPTTPVNQALRERQALFSIEKARTLLGYEPQHSWIRYVDENG